MNKVAYTFASVLLLSAAAIAHGQPSPGASGIGDPYYPDYGDGGYDVQHYDIRIQYDPNTDHVLGTTTILAKALQDLSAFNLDFVLHVDSVFVNNKEAQFKTQGEHELVIEPAEPIALGATLLVVVRYEDVPSAVKVSGVRTGWLRTSDGANVAGEPEVAWWFFPSNDHPRDKATFDISVTVPQGVSVVSNGVLTKRASPNGWTEWDWRSTKPQQTYLAFLAIGQYTFSTDLTDAKRPVYNAYSNALGASAGAARASVERTAEIIAWEESLFGPYPFEAIGGVVLPPDGETGFSLEAQTRPVYSSAPFKGAANPYLIVHENAHQWFGDSVALDHWSDVWLNEGFATYTEWLWSEKQGEGTTQEIFDHYYNSFPADDAFWRVVITDPGAGFTKLFANPVYKRGAMALQQLRVTIGDAAFFELLRSWAATHQYSNGTTEELEALAEDISKCDVSGLFEAWLSTPTRPTAVAATTYSAPVSLSSLEALFEFKH